MKETKVYVDELPKSCVSCKYFAEHRRQCNLEICLQWSEDKFKFNDCPLHSIKDHDREKDKQIKELEQKVQELQEVDNKRAFRLYAVLYDVLEKQDSENVASRIDYLTGKDYSEMCEMYKTAKNIKQHDKELVAKIIEFINELAWKDVQYDAFQSTIGEFSGSTSAIPRYAKKYFDLWKEMFGEDLENKG